MNPHKFIQDLKSNVFCRLGVSKIHGVGVFAIRPIPAGINPIRGWDFEFNQVKVADVMNDPHLTNEQKQLVKDMCPEEEGVYWIPPFSMNDIGVAYYLNHSKTPNMRELDGEFFSIRPIEVGEELLVDYSLYSELNIQ